MNFHDASLDLKSLEEHFLENVESIVSNALENGKDLCEEYGVETIKRIRFAKNIGEKKALSILHC